MATGRKVDKVAQLYAKTLYEIASEKDAAEKGGSAVAEAASDLRALREGIAGAPGWVQALRNPTVTPEQKASLVAPVAQRLSETVRKFVKLLELKGRLAWLPGIVEAFVALEEARRGVRWAQVVSAAPLTEAQVKELAAGLERNHPGFTYRIETSVDPDLVAGFRLIEGDRVVDTSLRRKLDTLKEAFAA